MKRHDGYLLLNDLLDKDEIEILNTKSITKIGASDNKWIVINGKRFFIKNNEDWERELVCSEFSHLLGLDSVSYYIALINGDKYIISEDYQKQDKKYISGSTIIDDFYFGIKKENPEYFNDSRIKNETIYTIARMFLNNLDNIWSALLYKYKNNINREYIVAKLVTELEKRFLVRSVLLMDNDYHSDNWCIEEGEDVDLVPGYDYGSCLKGGFLGMPFGVFIDDTCDSHLIQFETYLDYTAKESVDKFIELFEKATPELFCKAIENVEEKIETKLTKRDELIEFYTNNYDELKKLITDYRGKYGR